jgi:glutamyl-tRNA reductase
MGSSLCAAGISHRTAPVETRELFSVSSDEQLLLLKRLRGRFGSGFVLSTCNRTELYVSDPSGGATGNALLKLLFDLKGQATASEDAFYELSDEEAARHLFRVACGVDSMVVGEAQILGQVRSAMSAAHSADSIDSLLSKLLHNAIRLGRRARHETAIARYGASVSTLAIKLGRRLLGSLKNHTVLVVSAGEAGKLAAKALSDAGVRRLLITNRDPVRAEEIATLLGGTVLPFDNMVTALAQADIVVSSSGASEFLVKKKVAAEALALRDGKPILFIDIAVPRDIDPAIRDLPNAHLYDIDDLDALVQGNVRQREREVQAVEAMVEAELDRFGRWRDSLDVVPTISALRRRADDIRTKELQKTLAKMPALDDDERKRLEAMTGAIVKKLLHEPIRRLRDIEGGREHTAALRHLFGLDEEA